MEGFTLFRLGVIGALFAGSFYVLLPTLLQEDSDAELAAKAAEVNAPAPAKSEIDLDLEFTVGQGDPTALSAALGARLTAANVSFSRVVVEDGLVVAKLGLGADNAAIVTLAEAPGVSAILAPSSLIGATVADPGEPDLTKLPAGLGDALKVAGADLGIWTKRLPELVGAVPMGAQTMPVQVQSTVAAGEKPPVMTLSGALTEPFGVVALDGVIVGVAVPADGATTFYTLGGDPVPLLVGGPLPGALKQAPAKASAGPAPAASAPPPVVAESQVPQWLRDLLPDTKMVLGLDLQGGIDLTLQVELDDAVQAQVSRDATWLRDRAPKAGFEIESVRAERTDPIVWVTSSAPLDQVTEFVRSGVPDYEYASSNGAAHGYRMRDARIEDVQKSAVEQVLETLRKRVNETGVKEPSIVKKGGGRINVQLPGKVDLQQAVDALGTTAVLEFRLVDEEFDTSVLDQHLVAAKAALPPEQFANDDLVNDWLWQNKRLDDDHIVMWEYSEGELPERVASYALKREVPLTGADVNDAGVSWDQNQQPYVSLDFKPRGAQVFCELTTANVGKRFAIILDDRVTSSPVIRDKICGGSAKIDMSSGDDPMKDAQTLALVLRTGSLDAPVVIGEVRNVGAQLGKDSVNAGLTASGIGSLFVILFMTVWYKGSGVVANIALAANVMMMLAGLAMFGATLTLPGIAGIALTVGMAVDANIIIYERIRDEIKLGVNPRKAVDAGFENATSSILDSNITTAIAGVVLYSYGTGPIRGFAVTLLVGIVTTLISALFVSRSLMELQARYSNSRLSI